jgi:hypothetical protein
VNGFKKLKKKKRRKEKNHFLFYYGYYGYLEEGKDEGVDQKKKTSYE